MNSIRDSMCKLADLEDNSWGATAGIGSPHAAGKRTRQYENYQLNNVLREQWEKERDLARSANEIGAKLRQQLAAAKEQAQSADAAAKERAQAAEKASKEMSARLVAVQLESDEFRERLRAREEELEVARGTVLALERRAEAAGQGPSVASAGPQAESVDKLSQDVSILRGKLFRCRERLESANQRAAGAETRAAEGGRELGACREDMKGCRANRSATIDQLTEYKARARAAEEETARLREKLSACHAKSAKKESRTPASNSHARGGRADRTPSPRRAYAVRRSSPPSFRPGKLEDELARAREENENIRSMLSACRVQLAAEGWKGGFSRWRGEARR
ncbi:hypothetical protein T484DRAFT_1913363 [Baffinella frigidus]|nr:hypothetical protein T484DRAFT_1913363 [Cryptophyta sp. CCMP2293]